jgi:F/Y-rich N-terminus/SET domain/PHD-like zinc-binding domain/F/Y rich C-terminus
MDLVVRGTLPTGETCSPAELHVKLVEQVEWEMRHLWKQEYMDILREGLRVYGLVLDNFQDARIISQHALTGVTDLPMHVIQRALRFVSVVKRAKWDTPDGVAPERVEVVIQTAKLAAAFLRVADAVLNALTLDTDVYMNDRFVLLLEAPDDSGQMWFPVEPLRPSDVAAVESALSLFDSISTIQTSSGRDDPNTNIFAKVPSPLCGWSKFAQVAESGPTWKDPRECCLCHLCGDDDAGFIDRVASESKDKDRTIHLGRLLPFSDGGFVHTGCALWSSEVWEDSSESLVHAVEKARSRGSQLKCFGCGSYGATVGCNKSNCMFNYHLPCAMYCGAVFTTDQQVFCASHRTSATTVILEKVTFEPMKTIMIADERKNSEKECLEGPGSELCSRLGALVVHSLGKIEYECDGFHSEDYITPPGYMATRIFWSVTAPRDRTLYVLKIEKVDGEPQFSITPADNPLTSLTGSTAEEVYETLLLRVKEANSDLFSVDDFFSKLPAARRTMRKTFGLNGPQFFGFGLDHIRKVLETRPGVEAVVAPLTDVSPKYRFCFHSPQLGVLKDLMRKRAAVKAEQALKNSSGCARTEGIKAVTVSGGSGRITRALVRSAEEDLPDGGAGSSAVAKKGEEKARLDRNQAQVKYKRMKSVPLEHRLVTRRSHIHGWGLFTKLEISKDDPIVEYMGEIIRQPIADIRENAYEISGEGSCYMFRLDLHRIVDATKIGCMARFMNHSCQPNAYAKLINVDTEAGQDRKIVVFANRDIASGEEITYGMFDGDGRLLC